MKKILPRWVLVWLIISMGLVFWDVMFVLLRPMSFVDGMLGYLFFPYKTYIAIDLSYGNLTDAFVKTQALMSLLEIAMGVMGICFYFWKKIILAVLLVFSSQLLTGVKTILIFLMEMMGGFAHVGHNGWGDLIGLYILPNALWVFMPLWVTVCLGKQIILATRDPLHLENS